MGESKRPIKIGEFREVLKSVLEVDELSGDSLEGMGVGEWDLLNFMQKLGVPYDLYASGGVGGPLTERGKALVADLSTYLPAGFPHLQDARSEHASLSDILKLNEKDAYRLYRFEFNWRQRQAPSLAA